jgi:geranylgeranyl pyrophosphate synthase
MVIKAKQYFKESWESIVLNSKKSDLKKNIFVFLNEKKIIEETKENAESYFKKSRKILKELNHINSDELFMFVDLLENRSF